MKFAVCNETFQDWPFDRAFSFARELGYTGIEIAPFTIDKYAYNITAAKRKEIVQQAAAAGLEVVGLHWLLAFTEGFYLTTSDAAVRRKTSEYLTQLVHLCKDLGGSIMVLGSPKQRNLLPGVSHDDAMKFAADTIRGMVPALDECNVTLALEPLGPEEGDFLRTADLGVELMRMVDSPRVQLHLDVKAMSSESKPVCDIIRDNIQWTAHFHANDPNRRGPGMGEVDFIPIFRTLKELNYDRWVSVEVFDYAPGIETLARESMQNMRRCCDALQIPYLS